MRAAFVIPWYGPDIPGGAEAECRRTAENLAQRGTAVEVLTTTLHSLEKSWDKGHHRPGKKVINGVTVRRFPIGPRQPGIFNDLNQRLIRGESLRPAEERAFFENMVNSEALYEFIATAGPDYLFLPIPYLFSTTIQTARLVPERCLPIACLHDEGYAYMDLVRQALVGCRGIIFHTRAEMELAEDILGFPPERGHLFGEGIETSIQGDGERFRKRRRLSEPFILYAGRRDATKNTPLLLDYFARYKRQRGGPLKLALMGNLPFEKPEGLEAEVIDLGFLSAQEKADAYAAADIFCQPSVNESFSIVIMEAWLCGTPVLVHGDCAATREHAEQSGGGLTFTDQRSFDQALDRLLGEPELAVRMAGAGREYVLKNFHWDPICHKYTTLLEEVSTQPRPKAAPVPVRQPAVHQVLADFAPGDPVSDEARAIRRRFKDSGQEARIYAQTIDQRVRRQARPLERFREEAGPGDVILFHYSGGEFPDWADGLDGRKLLRCHTLPPGNRPADLVLAATESGRQGLAQAGYQQTAVIGPVLDYLPLEAKAQDRSHSTARLLFAGRLAPDEGVEAIIKAFYFFKRLEPEARLILAGGLPRFQAFQAGLKNLIQELALKDFLFTGQLNPEELAAQFAQADLYLSLDRGPLAAGPILRAMAAGLPVVASANGPGAEVLGPGSVLVEDGQPSRVAETTHALLADSELCEQVLSAQRRRLEELDPWSQWERLWGLLKPLLGAGGGD